MNRRRVVTLEDLRNPSGPPHLTTGELGAALGFSDDFIREEINCGELKAIRHQRRERCRHLIPWTEARRYARQLGLLTSAA